MLGIGLAALTGADSFDVAARYLIGVLLVANAAFLAWEMASLLVGEPAEPDAERAVRQALAAESAASAVAAVRAVHLGPDDRLVVAELRDHPDRCDAGLLGRLGRAGARARRAAPTIRRLLFDVGGAAATPRTGPPGERPSQHHATRVAADTIGSMAIVESSGVHHLRLTVTDIARSVAFYDSVFGWQKAVDASAHVDEPGVRDSQEHLYGGVVYVTGWGMLLGLRPVAPSEQRFDSTHAGLDHLSFTVPTRQTLLAVRDKLDEAGIPHGEVHDLAGFGIAILSFSDPDGVHLELTAPL